MSSQYIQLPICSCKVLLCTYYFESRFHERCYLFALLQINPAMPSNELGPFIARHVPPHQSLSAKYICHFRKKVIGYTYICPCGRQRCYSSGRNSTFKSNTVAEEKIATDSSISRNHVESLLLNVMAKGDLWDVITLFKELQKRRVLFFGLR